ncbi:hypothetical protein JD969_06670 [Planctomycetota bacterium]|nr:hypothetical protein JD969_06670 [Planctomycetota bacterium]
MKVSNMMLACDHPAPSNKKSLQYLTAIFFGIFSNITIAQIYVVPMRVWWVYVLQTLFIAAAFYTIHLRFFSRDTDK